jgi:hypothetical protein
VSTIFPGAYTGARQKEKKQIRIWCETNEGEKKKRGKAATVP